MKLLTNSNSLDLIRLWSEMRLWRWCVIKGLDTINGYRAFFLDAWPPAKLTKQQSSPLGAAVATLCCAFKTGRVTVVEGTTEPGKRSLSEFIKYQGNIAGTGSVSRAGALVPLITTDKKPGAKGGGGKGGRPDLPETLLQITEVQKVQDQRC